MGHATSRAAASLDIPARRRSKGRLLRCALPRLGCKRMHEVGPSDTERRHWLHAAACSAHTRGERERGAQCGHFTTAQTARARTEDERRLVHVGPGANAASQKHLCRHARWAVSTGVTPRLGCRRRERGWGRGGGGIERQGVAHRLAPHGGLCPATQSAQRRRPTAPTSRRLICNDAKCREVRALQHRFAGHAIGTSRRVVVSCTLERGIPSEPSAVALKCDPARTSNRRRRTLAAVVLRGADGQPSEVLSKVRKGPCEGRASRESRRVLASPVALSLAQ